MLKISIEQIREANKKLGKHKDRIIKPYIVNLSQDSINNFFKKAFKKLNP